jgi:hypothetical protein
MVPALAENEEMSGYPLVLEARKLLTLYLKDALAG